MARTIGDEQLQLKKRARRRLIGAIALVTLMVLVLPLLLDGESKPVSPDISIQIAPGNGGAFTSRVVPVPEKSGEAVDAEKVQKAENIALPPLFPAAKPNTDKPTESAKTTEKKAGKSAKVESKSGAYVVQLAAFSNSDKAKQLQQKLTANGIRAYTEVLKTAGVEKIRVRAGPYESRDAAEKALERLKTLGMDGVVTSR
ncbi:MAG TPA: SPOR domain-containing protein [Burkholderiales bacterium]|nr:SPOR domain-containing protein [Burkholderiales bacterium]